MEIKLVIVDDAPFIREVLRHIFSGTEVRVVGEAADGERAVEVVRATGPDVVLMDIVMPKLSGIEGHGRDPQRITGVTNHRLLDRRSKRDGLARAGRRLL